MDEAERRAASASWLASLQVGDRTLIFGLFAGRPPAETLAALYDDILTGKIKAGFGYSSHGDKIAIFLPPGG